MLSVLFVDDNPAFLEVITLLAEQSRRVSFHTVQSAKEAKQVLARKSFDAIVLDYEMPDTNGIEFLKILRSGGNTLPVIIFTGASQESAAIDAVNFGADAYVKKGTDPQQQFTDLLRMIEQSIERKKAAGSPATTRKVVSDLIDFSSDPTFAIDPQGIVLAWNEAMEQLTDIPAAAIVGKGDFSYAEPFFGRKKKMLVDLIFDTDEAIKKQKYMLVSRVRKGPVVAVTTGMKPDKEPWTLWMKAMPAYDSRGTFMAAIGSVRDITATITDVSPGGEPTLSETEPPVPSAHGSVPGQGRERSHKAPSDRVSLYREGLRLQTEEQDYRGAITAFDKLIALDGNLAYAWNDRGLCYLKLNDLSEALRSFLRAAELEPTNAELQFNLGETLEKIGVMYMNTKYLDSAIQAFTTVAKQVPGSADVLAHIGVCLKDLGRIADSEYYFDRAHETRAAGRDTPVASRRDEFLRALATGTVS